MTPEFHIILPDVRATNGRGKPREITVRANPQTGVYIELIGRDGMVTTFARIQNESGGVWITTWNDSTDTSEKRMVWG